MAAIMEYCKIFHIKGEITIFLLLQEAKLNEAATGDRISEIVGISESPALRDLFFFVSHC